MSELKIQESGKDISIIVKVVPGSSRTAIAGILDGMLKVKVAAAPEKGNANKELTAFLASKLKLKKRDISIVSGHTSPVKQIKIVGSTAEMVAGLTG